MFVVTVSDEDVCMSVMLDVGSLQQPCMFVLTVSDEGVCMSVMLDVGCLQQP